MGTDRGPPGCSACLCNSCSGLRLWIPAIGEPTEGNGFLIRSIFYRALVTVLDEFLDHTGRGLAAKNAALCPRETPPAVAARSIPQSDEPSRRHVEFGGGR